MTNANPLRVFVVDDEELIVITLAKILEMSGFAASPFTDPREALHQAEKQTPNLLLSDVAMPEMSGVELAIHIKERHPRCKVLLFSGQAATTDLLSKAREEGYNFRMLIKPVHPADLLAAIRTLP